MNSIFSSFDAACAEFLGQTVKVSFTSSLRREPKETQITSNLSGKEGNSPPAVAACTSRRSQQEKASPRFAPELDGLNCFETLISF
ncbi:hypothetical protein NMG60_11026871 [Bertholletia excelsa]